MDSEDELAKNSKKFKVRPTQSYYIPPAQRATTRKKLDEIIQPSEKPLKVTTKLKDSKKCLTQTLEEIPVAISTSAENLILEGTTEATEKKLHEISEILNIVDPSQPLLPIVQDELVLVDTSQQSECNLEKDNLVPNCDSDVNTSSLNSECLILEEKIVDNFSPVQTEIKISLNDLRSIAESIFDELIIDKDHIEQSTREKKLNKIVYLLEKIIGEEEVFIYEQESYTILGQDMKNILKQKFIAQFTMSDLDIVINEEPDLDDLDLIIYENIKLSNSENDLDSDTESTVISPLLTSDVQVVDAEDKSFSDIQVVDVEDKSFSDTQVVDVEDQSFSDTLPLIICFPDDSVTRKNEDCDTDNENEEMKRAIANISRRKRSLIKHIHNVNTLFINEEQKEANKTCNTTIDHEKAEIKNLEQECIIKQNNLIANWEDMFDENGDLHSEYVGEIVKQIGYEVKVVKAGHDYSDYQNPNYQDLEHVIELYDFPATLKTQDIMQLYRSASEEPMYVKWCDDTHCLLVLSTPAQAQRALQIDHDIIKSRPLGNASPIAVKTASSSDLKPAMKRPATTMSTARRLINTYLGTKSTLSREEIEQERQALRDAREQRRLERQSEKDAWEGRPRNTKS